MGLTVSCQDIIPWSRFHLRPLQAFLRPYATLIENNTYLSLTLPANLRTSLDWWLEPHHLYVGTSLDQTAKMVITTNASLSRWGACLQTQLAQGQWSAKVGLVLNQQIGTAGHQAGLP